MKTPFLITITPKNRLFRCPARIKSEMEGSFCHPPYCPDCKTVPDGWELWGENGHLQGAFSERPDAETLKRHASRFSSPTEYIFKERGFTYLGN